MTTQTTLLVAIGLFVTVGSSLLLWSANLDDAADSGATQPEVVVTIAVAPPPQASLSVASPIESTASLPATVPAPQRVTLATPVEMADDAEPAQQAGIGEAAVIEVLARPIPVLAGPSSSAAMLYGFPAGRPLRVLGHEAGFAQIVDLKTGTRGWIDETALAPSTLTAAIDPEPTSAKQPLASISPDAKLPKTNRRAAAQIEPLAATAPDQKRNRRGLFGGTKRADDRDRGFSNFLTRTFGGSP